MRPEERDHGYLWDMLDAARLIQEYTDGSPLDAYLADRKLQLAIERLVEIIGEAARRVSDDFKQTQPDVPWRGIVSQRHVLAHKYGEIEQERIWRVATEHVPALIAQLEPLVPPTSETD